MEATRDLRNWLEAQGFHYVLAVACDEPVAFPSPRGHRREEAALVEKVLLERLTWHRLSMSDGTKGPRLFDWALVPMLHRWEDDGCHFLLIRRNLADHRDKRYYFVFAPAGSTLGEIVAAIGCRWHIEEDFENAKDLGLDHYEVRGFIGWYRHQTLVMVAMAYLASIVAEEKTHARPVLQPGAPLCAFPLRPLTIPEVHHLLALLIWPTPRQMTRALECRELAKVSSKPRQLFPRQTPSGGRLIGKSTVCTTIGAFFSLCVVPGISLGMCLLSQGYPWECGRLSWTFTKGVVSWRSFL